MSEEAKGRCEALNIQMDDGVIEGNSATKGRVSGGAVGFKENITIP